MIRVLLVLAALAGPLAAQSIQEAEAAKLRLLDKLTGAVQDLTLSRGQSKTVGRLTVQMDACRYDPENPAAEAFVHLTILDAGIPNPVFNGWMAASSPALSALDHPRYDVWPLRCDVADLVLPDVEDPVEDDTPTTDDTGQ